MAPDGGNSFFVNGPDGRYQDLVTQDVLAHVAATYRVKPGRDGRALLGISMGGYAALRIAFQQPDVFRAVATHSAMLLEKVPSPQDGAGRWHMAAFQKVFGDPIDTARWTEADPLVAAQKADPKTAPALYFDCGKEDRYGLFVGNQDLDKTLTARGVTHTFSLDPGDHGYEFVRAYLARSLKFLGSALVPAAKEPKASLALAPAPSAFGLQVDDRVRAKGVIHRSQCFEGLKKRARLHPAVVSAGPPHEANKGTPVSIPAFSQ